MNKRLIIDEGFRSMSYSSSFLTSFLVLVLVINVASAQPLVPALFIFGDSVADVGNNNHLFTAVKANFPPYGRDFENHCPTGRFCNGKLATDLAAEFLGFNSYQPAYLNLETKGNNLLNGANFASAASGYHESTAKLWSAISLSQQLEYFKECQNKLVEIAGQSNAASIISGALYLLSSGTNDFVLNYHINPLVNQVYTTDQFSDMLLQCYSNFIQNLYALGARRIGVTTLPPMGCLPASITLFGSHSSDCVANLNNDAVNFNNKLNAITRNLQQTLPSLKLALIDIYQPLYDLVTKPSENGLFEARKACCGTGLLEAAVACNEKSIGTCANASEYVFWDSLHPTEATNRILATHLISCGISLIS